MTYAPQASVDHVKRALANLLFQFQNKANIKAIVASYVARIQELENATWEVISLRYLDNAFGVQLDAIGRLVGRGRENLADVDYKIALRAQIRINRSFGTPLDMCEVALLSLPIGYMMTYDENYPAGILMSVVEQVQFSIATLFYNLKLTKAGGVRLLLEFSTDPIPEQFMFAPGNVSTTDAAHGFGNALNLAIGGKLGNVLEG